MPKAKIIHLHRGAFRRVQVQFIVTVCDAVPLATCRRAVRNLLADAGAGTAAIKSVAVSDAGTVPPTRSAS